MKSCSHVLPPSADFCQLPVISAWLGLTSAENRCTLFDPLERDRTMHAGIRVWQERGPGQLHVPGAGEELQR
jgi:hypothetical protein